MNKKNYSFLDTVTDISTGAMSRLFDILVLIVGLSLYENFRKLVGGLLGISLDFSVPISQSTSFPFIELHLIPIICWSIIFILADFVFYSYHRVSHEINFFWAAHVVHHSSEEYNLSVALRQTLFRNVFYLVFALPLCLLNIPWEVLIISDALNRTYQFWTHTKLIKKMPTWFEFIFVTPSHHRVHHAVNPVYIDKNYAGVFILWDRVLGTFAKEEEEPVYGITKRLNTFNPVSANFHVYKDIILKWLSSISLSDKIGYTFRYPGWEPSQKERFFPPIRKETTNSYQISSKQKFMTLISGGLIILSALIFIRKSPDFSLSVKSAIIVIFFILFWILGAYLDRIARKNATM